MNDEQQRIWDYLTENAQGWDDRKTSDQIREECNLVAGGPTNEHPRDLIKQMVNDYGLSIGSDQRGYWIIQNEPELEIACNYLLNKARANNERAENLRRNWENRDNG